MTRQPDEDAAPYGYRLTPAAARALGKDLPPAVAFAVYEFITAVVVNEPRRVGKPLAAPYDGRLSARRGTYRIIYSIDDSARVVTVEHIDHRRDAYRRR